MAGAEPYFSQTQITADKLILRSRTEWAWLGISVLGLGIFYFLLTNLNFKKWDNGLALPLALIVAPIYFTLNQWQIRNGRGLHFRHGFRVTSLANAAIEDIRLYYYTYTSFTRMGVAYRHDGFRMQSKKQSISCEKK